MNILGISDVTGNHSHSCVAILQDDKLAFALSQERISRIKNDSSFPFQAIQSALDYTGLRLQDIDAFACAYPPPRYYASLRRDGYFDLPRSLMRVMLRRPVLLSRYLTANIKKGVIDPQRTNGLFELRVPEAKFRWIDHHLAHVSAGYFSSGFEDALAISYGGFAPHLDGSNVAGAVYRCQGDRIEFIEDIPMSATGCYFSGVTVALGFKYMAQEGKTMGLARTADFQTAYDRLKKQTTCFSDGVWHKYPFWVDYIQSPRADAFVASRSGRRLHKWIAKTSPAQVAAAAQHLWEENVLRYITHLQTRYPFRRLVLSGGVFANVQINRLVSDLPGIEQVYIHPHPGDGSTAIGAALETSRQLVGKPVQLSFGDSGWGVDFTERAIETAIRRFGSRLYYEKREDFQQVAAQQLAQDQIVGWFQGREEYGARALGHRCILADPRRTDLKDKITGGIKNREHWIPIAPSILAEHASAYLEDTGDKFMQRVCRVRSSKRNKIAAAVHSDGSARVQLVDQDAYKPFRQLLESFHRLTGIPMLLNTSFNAHGEPIVHLPEEAINIFLAGDMDVLVIGPFIIKKDKVVK